MCKYYLVFVLLLYAYDTSAGGICVKPKITPSERKYSSSEAIIREDKVSKEALAQRELEIRLAVGKISLPKIFVMHVRTTTRDYDEYVLSPDELIIFRQEVKKRYEANRTAIDAIVNESIEAYRRTILAPEARKKRKLRHYRQAWRVDPDLMPSIEPAAHEEEQKYPVD